MKSGWIINYKDGGKVFFSEEAYAENAKHKDLNKICSEEHWFDMNKLFEKYPWVKLTP